MKQIYVQPCDVWEHYKENEQEFANRGMETIATNPTTGVEITLQKWNCAIAVVVGMDGEEIDSEFLFSGSAAEIVEDMYDKYLSDNVFDYDDSLDDALMDMLEVFYPGFTNEIDDVSSCIDDLKEIITSYLSEVYGLYV